MATNDKVSFIPNPVLCNKLIGNFNDLACRMPPQDHAAMVSAHVASVAFMMVASGNDPEDVKKLFGFLVDDAKEQLDRRMQEMKTQGKNVN